MKKKLILTISIIIIVALIGGIILSKKAKENTTTNQDIKYTANIKELDLTKQMKTELNKISHNNSLYYDITGSNSKNYYGVIYEEPDSGLANSIGVFFYDKSSKKLEITKHNFHSSIIGYTSYNNNYYYIALKDNQDSGYNYQLIKNNHDLTNAEIIKLGYNYLLTNTPVLINNSAYFYCQDKIDKNSNLEDQICNLYSLKDNKEITINNYQTSKEYLTKTWNISIKNNNIYLDLIKDDTSSIYEKNLDNTQSNSLFTTKNIFSYIKLNGALVLTTLDEKESSTLQVVKNNQSILTKDYAGIINIYKVSSTKVLIESNNKYEIYNLENNKIQEITFNEDISGYKIRFLENNNLLITNDLDSKIIEITT